jgi:hypothetical protein
MLRSELDGLRWLGTSRGTNGLRFGHEASGETETYSGRKRRFCHGWHKRATCRTQAQPQLAGILRYCGGGSEIVESQPIERFAVASRVFSSSVVVAVVVRRPPVPIVANLAAAATALPAQQAQDMLELLAIFRTLTPREREVLMATARGLAAPREDAPRSALHVAASPSASPARGARANGPDRAARL